VLHGAINRGPERWFLVRDDGGSGLGSTGDSPLRTGEASPVTAPTSNASAVAAWSRAPQCLTCACDLPPTRLERGGCR
jgi:hypothetical protein